VQLGWEVRGSRLLWPAESQYGFIVVLAHKVSTVVLSCTIGGTPVGF
jgi:hypothetical protein